MTSPNPGVVSTYFGNLLLNYLATNGSWISLHTDDPTVTGDPSTELAGGDYGRVLVGWSAPAGKATATLSSVQFTGLLVASIRYIGHWDDEVGGHFLGSWLVDPAIAVSPTTPFLIGIADLALSLP